DRASGQCAMGFCKTVEELDREMENDQVNDFDSFNLFDELNVNASTSCIHL
ncbi:hypothetical protein PanWU01x14_232020, partial [Parasponia andersonii]